MSEVLPVWFGNPEISSFGPESNHMHRKIMCEIPEVGHATIVLPARTSEEDPFAELVDFQLDGAYSIGEGPDTLLAESAIAAAKEQGALVLNIPLYDDESAWFLQSFRTVPGRELLISERMLRWDPADPDQAPEYDYEKVEGASLSWVMDQLNIEKASGNHPNLEDPSIPERYLVQVLL